MIPGNANPLLLASAAAADTAANITKSVRFNKADAAHLERTPSSAGNRKTWTFSMWFKHGNMNTDGGIFLNAQNGSTQNFANNFWILYHVNQLIVGDGSTDFAITEKLRDSSAWYHFVVACDTTQSTASDRLKVYINGVEASLTTDGRSSISQNSDTTFNSTFLHQIGNSGSWNNYGEGYYADMYLIDGSALDPTSFGAFDSSGVWQAAAYSGTFGTNGFHLFDFASESTVGHDSSGNENDFTATNISTTAGVGNDVLFDVPTNGTQSDTGAGGEVSGNYCTLNPLDKDSNVTLSNGNLDATTSSSAWSGVKGTLGVSSGKHYFEFTYGSGNSGRIFVGICSSDVVIDPSSNIQDDSTERAKGMLLFCDDGQTQLDNNSRASAGTTPASGDIIGVSFDLDGNTAQFYQNGSALGSIDISSSPLASTTVVPIAVVWQSGVNHSLNFGQRAWAYSAPSNHKALCTTNLPTPTIADGSDYFDIALYTGDGTSPRSITLPIAGDLLWMKARNDTASHQLVDTVRGNNAVLISNSANEERDLTTQSVGGGISSLSGTTAVITEGTGTNDNLNENNKTYVAWTWDAGSSTVSNTDGSITSQVRASATSGFSIVTYTGNGTDDATFGHGLSASPEMIWVKRRDSADDWFVYTLPTANNILKLNKTSAASGSSHFRTMSSSTFQLSGNADVNANNGTFVAYCFAPVAGHSQISTWVGNGSTDGPFVHTGFRPAFILYKASDAAEHWHIRDTARDPHNVTQNRLLPSSNIAEGGDADFNIDILSNGFKLRASNATQNQSGTTYVYYAVAENSFQANGGLAR